VLDFGLAGPDKSEVSDAKDLADVLAILQWLKKKIFFQYL